MCDGPTDVYKAVNHANGSTSTRFITHNDILHSSAFVPAVSRSLQVRIDGDVFTISTKMKHEFSASGITLDRKVCSVRV